jgi:REP element-mobilizing transposase RayT
MPDRRPVLGQQWPDAGHCIRASAQEDVPGALARIVITRGLVIYPRHIVPGKIWLLTRRTSQRQFLLRPDEAMNQTFLYVLADAVARYGIRLLGVCVEASHEHLVFEDPRGEAVEFYEHLHKFVAKAGNALRGRSEHFWSSAPPSLVELVEPGDVLDKLVYCLTNPVKDYLVERVHHWPGVNTLSALLNDRRIVCKRPRHFFSADGSMPEELTLELSIPCSLGDPEAFRRELRARVAAVEAAAAESRGRTGRRVLGRRAILEQDWRARPSSTEPPCEVRPVIAAKNPAARAAAMERLREFIGRYRRARDAWLAGLAASFPFGTYWLRRFGGVTVEPRPAT